MKAGESSLRSCYAELAAVRTNQSSYDSVFKRISEAAKEVLCGALLELGMELERTESKHRLKKEKFNRC